MNFDSLDLNPGVKGWGTEGKEDTDVAQFFNYCWSNHLIENSAFLPQSTVNDL